MNKLATKNQVQERRIRHVGYLKMGIAAFMAIVIIACIMHRNAHAYDINYPESGVYYTSYTVKSGDTLYSIADEFKWDSISIKGYVRLVTQINNLPDEKILSGSDIIIPYEP